MGLKTIMNRKKLDEFLRQETDIELEQKRTGKNVLSPELHKEFSLLKKQAGHADYSGQMPEQPFFKKGNIFISKHNRYSAMPKHRHNFLELNYMYSGTCIQWIDEQEIVLEQGSIILFDRGSTHAINSLHEDDILINLLLRFESINTHILQKMLSQISILATFLAEAGSEKKGYLLFKGNEKINDIINLILREYYDKDNISNYLAEQYLPILFSELARSQHQEMKKNSQKDYISQCLSIIEKEYQEISLEKLALRVGFNSHYLGNMIKEKTGSTFKQLVQQQRMQNAYQLVIHTNYTMEEICGRIGLKDASYFYHSFKKIYGFTPNQMRKRVQKESLHSAHDS
jgi:YesN/AraC family two-component response regulator